MNVKQAFLPMSDQSVVSVLVAGQCSFLILLCAGVNIKQK